MPKEVIRRKTGKREALQQAAKQLFLTKGIRAVTVEEIVSEAGTSKATFYKYFADKAHILGSILAESADIVLDQLNRMVQQAKQERMSKEAFLKIFDVNEYDSYFQGPFFEELMSEYPQVTEEFMQVYIGKTLPVFRDLIRAAKIDGIVRMDVDTDVLLSYTTTLRRSLAHTVLTPPQGMDMKEFTEKYWDLYLYGIMGKREEHAAEQAQG